MTLKNSVLLMIKQSPGIVYNDLLSRISSRYKNPSSANSALSRIIKDMVSFGLVKKDSSKLFATDKGSASVTLEMKDKLIMRLNEEMKKPFPNPQDIVQLLVVLYQRSSQNQELLNTAKQNSTFTIKDIGEYRKKLFERRRFLKKMSILLKQQEEKLREIDFNDACELVFDQNFASKASFFCGNEKMILETHDEELLIKIPPHWRKQNTITVDKESTLLLLQLVLSIPSVKATLFLPGVKCIIYSGKVLCLGSHKSINSLIETKTPDLATLNPSKINQNEIFSKNN